MRSLIFKSFVMSVVVLGILTGCETETSRINSEIANLEKQSVDK